MKNVAEETLRELEGLFVQLRNHTRRVMFNRCADVTFGQLFILKQIAAGRNRVSELSGDIEASPAAASKVVDQLVRQGFVLRTRSAVDRRSALLELTKEGRALLARSVERRSRALMEMLAPLDSDELSQLVSLLRKMVQSHPGAPPLPPQP